MENIIYFQVMHFTLTKEILVGQATPLWFIIDNFFRKAEFVMNYDLKTFMIYFLLSLLTG